MGCVVNATPRPIFPPGKTRYPLYRRLGGPQGRSGRVRGISPSNWDSIPGPSSPCRLRLRVQWQMYLLLPICQARLLFTASCLANFTHSVSISWIPLLSECKCRNIKCGKPKRGTTFRTDFSCWWSIYCGGSRGVFRNRPVWLVIPLGEAKRRWNVTRWRWWAVRMCWTEVLAGTVTWSVCVAGRR